MINCQLSLCGKLLCVSQIYIYIYRERERVSECVRKRERVDSG